MEGARNVYQRINAVMKEVAYVKRDRAVQGVGAGYKAVTHDQLVSVARKAIVENGLVLVVSQKSGRLFEKGEKWNKDAGQMVPDNMRLYEGEYTVSLVNMDSPDDKASIDVVAHAMDNGDKAPGKAMTYATKSGMLKLLWLETGENDESREEIREKSRPNKQKLSGERFSNALDKVRNGEFPKERLLSEYDLSDEQKKAVEEC